MKSIDIEIKVRNKSRERKHSLLSEKLKLYNVILLGYQKDLCKLECKKCNTVFHNHPVTINAKIRLLINPCNICNPHPLTHSAAEKEVVKFIKNTYLGEVLENQKLIGIDGKKFEVDIFIPSMNIAIEYDGLYWHSEVYKDKFYHSNKTKKCAEIGVRLYHIWEDDWTYKREIVESRIHGLLSLSKTIAARKCTIGELSNPVYKKFCENNHIQGYGIAGVRIGIFYEGCLISAMGFSKNRSIISGNRNRDSYELIRFCSVKKTRIIGVHQK